MDAEDEILLDSEEEDEVEEGEGEDYPFFQNENHFQNEFKQLEKQFDCRNYSSKAYVSHIYEKRKIESSILYSVNFVSLEDSGFDSTDVTMSEHPSGIPAEEIAASEGPNDFAGKTDSGISNSSEPTSVKLPSYIYSASSNGKILIYEFQKLISNSSLLFKSQAKKNLNKMNPSLSLEAHEGKVLDSKFIYLNSKPFLFSCGEDGKIFGWKWNDFCLTKNDYINDIDEFDVFPTYEFQNTQKRGFRNSLKEISATNCLAIDTLKNIVYGGTNDGCINGYDLESEKVNFSIFEENDSIQCLSFLKSKSLIISGSKNGNLKIWDVRNKKPILNFDPFNIKLNENENDKKKNNYSKNKNMNSNLNKKPISCLSIDENENWMVCGSLGKTVTLFSLRDISPALRISTTFFPHSAKIVNEELIVGGSEPLISKWNLNGKFISKNVCFTESIFSIACHPFGLTMVGGYGGVLDVLTNYGSHLCTFRSY